MRADSDCPSQARIGVVASGHAGGLLKSDHRIVVDDEHKSRSHESPLDLGGHVWGNLLPGELPPDRKPEGDDWVDVCSAHPPAPYTAKATASAHPKAMRSQSPAP